MNSFTKKLVLYCTGVIFLSFMVVYFLFNVLVSNYIRAEAERELYSGIRDAVGISNRLVPSGMVGAFHPGEITHVQQFPNGLRISGIPIYQIQDIPRLPRHSGVNSFAIAGILPHPRFIELGPVTGFPGMRQTPGAWNSITIHGMEYIPANEFSIQFELSYWAARPAGGSIITTNVIMINDVDEIISPFLDFTTSDKRIEIEFLSNFYLDNRDRFANEEMVMATMANNSFYLRAVSQEIAQNPVSILLYTDISSAVAFQNSMNRILGLLLVLSGMISLAISILMSARFKSAIVKLCAYAETIGRGNFTEKAGTFKDTEFDQLSKSMDNMSNMLQAYENNQKQFFQNVSHELRTPLMSIQGYAEGILEDIFTKEEAASIILSEGQKMTGLVSELLYVSRIDNHEEAAKALLDVKNLLNECCECVKPIAQKSEKQLSVESFAHEIKVEANEEKLERAVINVLSNAIRHAKSDVKISCKTTGSNLEIIIEDDGDGINPEDLPHIFERFYKGENGNYGLGLAISRDIIKSLHGNITAQNLPAPKTGAQFTIALPMYK